MKHCYQCGRTTGSKPLFCQFCGSSFDVRLCPRLHPNPRYAEVCSECGSRELSTPQPKVSVWWRLLEFLLRLTAGAFLAALSGLVILAVLIDLARRTEVQEGLIAIGILLLSLWSLWTLIPDWLRKLITQSMRSKERNHGR
ncbi:MAG: zinc ribbon domain-containing protein [Terriglobales bacterium]